MDFAALIYHRQAFLDGQWWLPLSAQWVHFNAAHALANVAGGVLLWSLLRRWLRGSDHMVVIAGGLLGVAGRVVWDVHCDYYAGASGALHGWAAGGAAILAARHHRTSRTAMWIGITLLAAVVLKLLAELGHSTIQAFWGFPVYLPAHMAGALGGLVGAALTGMLAHHGRHKCGPKG